MVNIQNSSQNFVTLSEGYPIGLFEPIGPDVQINSITSLVEGVPGQLPQASDREKYIQLAKVIDINLDHSELSGGKNLTS